MTENNSTEKRKIWQVIAASSVGTLIEWYDFYIFGSLATILATKFFPEDNPTAGFLSTLALFAVGFVVRPFGAIVFGRLGDIAGRKFTFLLTLLLMGGSTFLIGLVPSYQTIGIWAPILVCILRLAQGLALGGEYGGAATYVAEHSPDNQRGYYTSWIQTTASLGLFVSLGVILGTRYSMTADQFGEWGWRIPFLLSIVLVTVSYFIRIRLKESPLFAKLKAEGKTSVNPIKESFGKKENLRLVLLALFGATAGQGVVWYTGQFYALSFMQKSLNIEFVQSSIIIVIALLFGTPFFILFGRLSDKIGRKPIMMTGLIAACILYYPLYRGMHAISVSQAAAFAEDGKLLLSTAGIWLMSALIFVQVVLVTMVYGPIAAFLVELFPTKIRYTSMSLPYHIGNGIFGGLTPFIAASVVAATGNIYAGLIYPIAVAAISFIIGSFYLRETYRNKMND
ncbi:putative MFS family arabinose efflux permease [Anseongella ginsenosidimutans]|uniref:Putative MFS family arabinose efflux permease n=1 Tax=Anseongella ginsenosidimutans TaxID=496056 RepID=A0A4R3KMF5_9SPHI|nr:MFS transporter [Anseongella ginsenosidimutans]QEC52522.1 MHS family MFS transporter [Anseongella ginsenosidimutans]TCS85294.1 putative MFS family arabinose efflux permease [Anseongella ginsenosidimutans]